jgi:hypothetical protein
MTTKTTNEKLVVILTILMVVVAFAWMCSRCKSMKDEQLLHATWTQEALPTGESRILQALAIKEHRIRQASATAEKQTRQALATADSQTQIASAMAKICIVAYGDTNTNGGHDDSETWLTAFSVSVLDMEGKPLLPESPKQGIEAIGQVCFTLLSGNDYWLEVGSKDLLTRRQPLRVAPEQRSGIIPVGLVAPTPTPTLSPAASSTAAAPQPLLTLTATATPSRVVTRTPVVIRSPTYAAPKRAPGHDGDLFDGREARVAWTWEGQLGDSEYYHVRAWQGSESPRAICWTKDTSWSWWPASGGVYNWCVIITRGYEEELSACSDSGWFQYVSPPSPKPPTPAPAPSSKGPDRPTPTPLKGPDRPTPTPETARG